MEEEGSLISDKVSIAFIINEFFANIARDIKEQESNRKFQESSKHLHDLNYLLKMEIWTAFIINEFFENIARDIKEQESNRKFQESSKHLHDLNYLLKMEIWTLISSQPILSQSKTVY